MIAALQGLTPCNHERPVLLRPHPFRGGMRLAPGVHVMQTSLYDVR